MADLVSMRVRLSSFIMSRNSDAVMKNPMLRECMLVVHVVYGWMSNL